MSDRRKILVVEDDPSTRDAWSDLIGSWGFEVQVAEDGESALERIMNEEPHIVLLDLKLPRKDGLAVLSEMRDRARAIPTIVVSGEGDVPDAVKAIKLGAYDYLRKPVDLPHLKLLLHNLCEHISISEQNRVLRRRLIKAGELGPLIGKSPAMQRVINLIEQVAPSSATVLITGESGSGKEIVARTIHELSPKRDGPYIAVNCAALPETLMESELFGHERGAFTGAERRREGCFELAKGGTLLLDEIPEMKIELPAKLLRVLEEQKLRRVGGTAEVPLDVRLIAASNRDLQSAVREKQLREDLYYRLNVFTIEVPPLRRRVEDISLLVEHFVQEFAQTDGRAITGVDNQCSEVLKAYSWPGNVRQLRNVVQRAVVVAQGPLVTVADLPAEVHRREAPSGGFDLRVGSSLDEVEQDLILRTLETVNGNKSRAAQILGISLKTLYNRLDHYRAK